MKKEQDTKVNINGVRYKKGGLEHKLTRWIFSEQNTIKKKQHNPIFNKRKTFILEWV